jgi:hypothetical protein
MENPNTASESSPLENEFSEKKVWMKPEAKSIEINYVGYNLTDEELLRLLAS